MNVKQNILVVDDKHENLSLLNSLLENEGYNISLADSGELALASLENNIPDLFLLDIKMPGINGFEVSKQIKEKENLATIPIIFISATHEMEDKLEGFRNGAVDFITKPFQKEELLIRIKIHLDLQENQSELTKLNRELLLAKEKAVESDRKIQTIFNNLQGIAYRCKNDGNWTMEFISAGCKKITGYPAEDIIENNKLSFNDLIIPEDKERIWKEIQIALSKKESFELNYQIKTATGEKRFLLEKGIGIFSVDGKDILALEGFITNITTEVQARADLYESLEREQLQAEIVKNSPVAIAFGYPDGRLENCNKAFSELTGYSEKELKSINWNDTLTPDKWNEIESKELEKLRSENNSIKYEKEYIHKNGKIIPIELVVKAKFDDENKIIHFIGFITDISERKQAENELIKYRGKLESLVEERTIELEKKNNNLQEQNKELERYNNLMEGREYRIKELRDEIEKLKK